MPNYDLPGQEEADARAARALAKQQAAAENPAEGSPKEPVSEEVQLKLRVLDLTELAKQNHERAEHFRKKFETSDAQIAGYQTENSQLKGRVAELEEQLKRVLKGTPSQN